MNYKKINNITGWAVGIFACIVYLMTMEGTISFWDCGEFAAGAAKLEVVHSPGAPMFLLIGRFFTILFGGLENAHAAINSLSALSSGFTILFLFWTITHFAKRIALKDGGELSNAQTLAIMAAGVVGGLAYTFSDTFWFSAVEAEVYAMSSFLTALAFWAILKWEDKVTEGDHGADRWIVFIAFIIGLSIGVHLLNLLTIPAIVMVYYFKKFNVTTLGTGIAFVVGCTITGVVQVGVIKFIPYLASKFDIVFVNDFGLPFNSGVYFFLLILAGLLAYLLYYSRKGAKYYLHLGVLSFIFILIGYSSYFQTVIRSNADVPIDMTNPDNAFSLVSYLSREQYGSQPILKGPDFTSRPIGYADNAKMAYAKGENEYIELGEKRTELEYEPGSERVFPRIWDANDPNHVRYYQSYLGLDEGEKPNGGHNFSFFLSYQVNQMWWRYFCWNYIGRQNDLQNIFGEPHHSNWLSGIGPIDKFFGRGDMSKAPVQIGENKAQNTFYFLPFILGILGLVFHFTNDKRNALVVGLLFFFTGLAIVIYLNNTPIQPRERDYAYAGATYAFAIWIGLGVLMVNSWLQKFLKGQSGVIAAGLLCLLAVPAIMGFKGWDDHDRSDKTLARDTATNYLQNLDKNAILFTEGDNDTYPLWFAQEIKNVRPDVRIINLSLLGIQWYIDQLFNATNEAGPVPMVWNKEAYRGDKLNYVQYQAAPGFDQAAYYNLQQVIQLIVQNQNPNGNSALPFKNLTIPVNKDNVAKSGILEGRDSLLANMAETIAFTYPRDVAYKNDLALLNILAANDWKRPIYFANSIDQNHYEGLGEYLELEGLVYKLVPYRTPGSTPTTPLAFNEKKCNDWVYNVLKFGHAEKGTVYYNQTNRRMLSGLNIQGFHIAQNLMMRNKKAEAIKVMDHLRKNMHPKSYPTVVTPQERIKVMMADGYMRAGAEKQATEVTEELIKYTTDLATYFKTLKKADQQPGTNLYQEVDDARNLLGVLINSASTNAMPDLATKITTAVNNLNNMVRPLPRPQGIPQQ